MKDEPGQRGSSGLSCCLDSSLILHPSAISSRGPRMKDNVRPRERVDRARIEAAVREILIAVGEDPDREGLLETPARVARMYAEIFAGLHKDPRELLQKT